MKGNRLYKLTYLVIIMLKAGKQHKDFHCSLSANLSWISWGFADTLYWVTNYTRLKWETSLSALWQVACLTVLFYSPIIWKDQNKFVRLKLGTLLPWRWNNLFVVTIKPTNPRWSKIKIVWHLYRIKNLRVGFHNNKSNWVGYLCISLEFRNFFALKVPVY